MTQRKKHFTPQRHGSRRTSVGFTLVEVLIATALSLLMMMALAEGFKRMSDSMTDGRANLALSDRLRSVTGTLRNDLERLTLRPATSSKPADRKWVL